MTSTNPRTLEWDLALVRFFAGIAIAANLAVAALKVSDMVGLGQLPAIVITAATVVVGLVVFVIATRRLP